MAADVERLTERAKGMWDGIADIGNTSEVRPSGKYEDHRTPNHGTKVVYTLPDGNVLHLSGEQLHAPTILFRPAVAGRENPGL